MSPVVHVMQLFANVDVTGDPGGLIVFEKFLQRALAENYSNTM